MHARKMKAYVGQTRGGKAFRRCVDAGLGEMTQPDEFPPRRYPWVLDNGAFKLWKSGKEFNSQRFLNAAQLAADHEVKPDFVVAPDVVADSAKSLPLSLQWAPILRGMGHKVALVVQDGMTREDVECNRNTFDVLFVGGTIDWKIRMVPYWANIGKELGMHVHVGRMGSRQRITYAKQCGVDSIDSCTPLFSEQNMKRFTESLDEPAQLTLMEPIPVKVKHQAMLVMGKKSRAT